MTTTPYTPEQRERDARIAVAMGTHAWFEMRIINRPTGRDMGMVSRKCFELPALDAIDAGYARCPTPANVFPAQISDTVPRFHESHDARAVLLLWLKADDLRWDHFIGAYFGNKDANWAYLMNDEEMVKGAFLATPDQVARAADAMIRGEGEK